MFSTVLGFFSWDLAVDPGSCVTRVHSRGQGVVAEEATLVALCPDQRGRRAVRAIGAPCLPMVGRAPAHIDLVAPIQGGRVEDYEVAEAFLLHLFRQIHGRNNLMRPRVVVPVPEAASAMELRALRAAFEAAGAREVVMVNRAIAAALGAGLSVSDDHGQLVIDLGAGSFEVALIAGNRVVAHKTLHGGGRAMDRAIVDLLKHDHGLQISLATAQKLKHELGAACEAEAVSTRVAGHCLRTKRPRATEVLADEICRAIGPRVDAIGAAIREVLATAGPAMCSDVVHRGVVLTGGASALRNLDQVLRRQTGLPVFTAPSPALAAVRGAGEVLEHAQVRRAVAC